MDIDPPQESQPQQNGTNGTEDRSPTPPPHTSSGSTDEADSYKLAGNKFFKDGNYRRAIEEYNKGMYPAPPSPTPLTEWVPQRDIKWSCFSPSLPPCRKLGTRADDRIRLCRV